MKHPLSMTRENRVCCSTPAHSILKCRPFEKREPAFVQAFFMYFLCLLRISLAKRPENVLVIGTSIFDGRAMNTHILLDHISEHRNLHCVCTSCAACGDCILCDECSCSESDVLLSPDCDGLDLVAAETLTGPSLMLD